MTDAASLARPAGLASAVPYAYAAIAPEGARLVFLAGSCPLDADGGTVAVGDVEGQAAVCVENLRIALEAAESTMDDVLFVRVIVATTSQADLAAAWRIVHAAFDDHEPPGTLQGATVLGWPDQLVEVEAVAIVRAKGC